MYEDGNSAPDRSIPDINRKGLKEVVSYATNVAENEIGGRKMAVQKVKEHGAGTGQAAGKWGSKMEHKQSVGHYFSPEVHDVDDDDEDAGFVAFSADYHPPRHHPPKNN
ncbi:hypothetical protein FEM48_Zijuj10G0105700 [Ziziphus jujuba var. spinosa]|uniref:Root meristem growth factor 3 n=1 Tax=Ziziphus jujuba var. spinosa TaxID=714518 RepID=A0A978UMV8_ZIZJJ|nr:hypothetical protein FEM48_Zijuj10G0105700 [Ziziphus jujuba var. spinosa]